MVYNISKAVVHRNQRYLDDMLESKSTLTWPTHDAKTLTYKIREALYAAQKHPEFRQYHPLKNWFRIRSRGGGGWVEAEYIGPIQNSLGDVHTPEGYVEPDVVDVESIVGSCIKLSHFANEIFFPKANLSNEGRLALYRWGKKEDWKLIDHGPEGVTMTRKRGVDELFLWSPEGDDG
ncbi:hypothetical protein LCGC14_1896350 [marine sediment metagenome]|uniref:Uncharacterized protein n=1 Tax=marine sediment metagenome TaxID=412755 RepID=A0A0F9IW37_9ZZZZ